MYCGEWSTSDLFFLRRLAHTAHGCTVYDARASEYAHLVWPRLGAPGGSVHVRQSTDQSTINLDTVDVQQFTAELGDFCHLFFVGGSQYCSRVPPLIPGNV